MDILEDVVFHIQKGFTGRTTFVEAGVSTEITLSEFDIIPDDAKAYPLIRKVKKYAEKFIAEVAWSRNPFGLSSTFFRDNGEYTKNDSNTIKCYSRGRKLKTTSRAFVRKNKDKIDHWKVVIPSAYAPGSKQGVRRVTLPQNQFWLIPKGEITTETYTIIDTFTSKAEAERFIVYLKTDFARYFLGLRKITQHIPKDRWDWVPLMDTSKEWTDAELFTHFKITKEEQTHIHKRFRSGHERKTAVCTTTRSYRDKKYLKVGHCRRGRREERINEQFGTANPEQPIVCWFEDLPEGKTDHHIHQQLINNGISKVEDSVGQEWFVASVDDVKRAFNEICHGSSRIESYQPRREQQDAVDKAVNGSGRAFP